ncbi:MAG: hypothetical protein QM308_09865 [Bacillota bacterium]|nr:hypothetical protein [Bacillota bacterium]
MQKTRQPTYKQHIMTGNQFMQHERIVVSSHVNVENRGEMDNRDLFVAAEVTKPAYNISLKWAFSALFLCVIFSLIMIGSKIALTESLKAEYAQLGVRYQAAATEKKRLQDEYECKINDSEIFRYVVDNLGMRLAGYEETINIQAMRLPDESRPAAFRGSASNGQ